MTTPPDITYWMLPGCVPGVCELLPVWAGRSFGQYDPHGRDPVGWVEEHILMLFLAWKDEGARLHTAPGLVRSTTMLDMAADAWLWSDVDAPRKSYSSIDPFHRWWMQQQVEMMQGRLL